MEAAHATQQNDNGDAPSVLTLTRKEAADRLKISQSMLDILAKKGAIRVCKVGRRRLFTPQALQEFVEQSETQPKAA